MSGLGIERLRAQKEAIHIEDEMGDRSNHHENHYSISGALGGTP